MILQALYKLAHAEGLAQDLDFQDLPVAWWVRLRDDGALLAIEDRREQPADAKGRAARLVAPRLRVPYQAGRTSGVAPHFMVDNAQYVFGSAPPDKAAKPERVKQCFVAFRGMVSDCVDATHDPAAEAVLRFLDSLAEATGPMVWNEEWASNDQFAFFLASEPDRPVHLRPAIVDYWRRQRMQEGSGEGAFRCLVTGARVSDPGQFPQVRKLPGGSPSGVSLVSFNNTAFLSHGWKSNENAPIGRDAAEACATALARLVDPEYPNPDDPGTTLPLRRYRLTSDTVVVYWSPEAAGKDACDMLQSLFDPDPGEVGEMYRSIWQGRRPAVSNPAAFYAMAITGTQGRIIVRDWLETTVEAVLTNLADYFADISIVRNTPKPKARDLPPAMPLQTLMRALAVNGDEGRLPPNLANEVFHAAITGGPFPRHILQRAVERTRAEATRGEWLDLERRDARAALVKAYLNRQARTESASANPYPEATTAMDPCNTNTGYLLGRLMALLEKLQRDALGDVNATIVDRYFKRAATTPQSVFSHLLKGANSHQKKLKQVNARAAGFYRREIDALLDKLSPESGLPMRLSLEDQALFLLGYHHQRHALWTKRDAGIETEADPGDEAEIDLEPAETE